MFNFIVERNSCSSTETFAQGNLLSSDSFELDKRLSKHADYEFLTLVQLCLMLFVLARQSFTQSKPEMRESPSWLGLIISFAMWTVVCAGRLRHSGIFGCNSGDSKCCGNMSLHASDGKIQVPGCITNTSRPIYAYLRDNFCPIPPWYKADVCQAGLRSTLDLSTFYTYGCSSMLTPVPYFVNRCFMCNELLFAVLLIAFKL